MKLKMMDKRKILISVFFLILTLRHVIAKDVFIVGIPPGLKELTKIISEKLTSQILNAISSEIQLAVTKASN